MNVIPEPDVYRLAVKSHLSTADRFERWVFEDVLPTIRQTGRFSAHAGNVETPSLAERRVRVMEMNAANRAVDHIIKTGGRREALRNMAEIYGKVGLRLELPSTLPQGELALESEECCKKCNFAAGRDEEGSPIIGGGTEGGAGA